MRTPQMGKAPNESAGFQVVFIGSLCQEPDAKRSAGRSAVLYVTKVSSRVTQTGNLQRIHVG